MKYHLNHDISIQGDTLRYLCIEIRKDKDLRYIADTLEVKLGLLINRCLLINSNSKEYIVIPTIVPKFKFDKLNVVDSISIDKSVRYKNLYDSSIHLKTYDSTDTYVEGLKRKDLKYIYAYTYHKLFLYFSINYNKKGERVLGIRDDLIWFHVKKISYSISVSNKLDYQTWKDNQYKPALDYFLKTFGNGIREEGKDKAIHKEALSNKHPPHF